MPDTMVARYEATLEEMGLHIMTDSAESDAEQLRPSKRYFRRHAGEGHTDADMEAAPPGSHRAAWLTWMQGHEQTGKWLLAHTELYTERDANRAEYQEMQATHRAYQHQYQADHREEIADIADELRQTEDSVVLAPETVLWWWNTYGLLQWNGALHKPVADTQLPDFVLTHVTHWYVAPAYPPLSDEEAAAHPKTPYIPNVFTNGMGEVSTAMPVFGLMRSIHGKANWQQGENGMFYQDWEQNKSLITTSLWPPRIVKFPDQMPDAGDITDAEAKYIHAMVTNSARMGGLSAAHGDVLTACIMQVLKGQLPDGTTWIDNDAILNYRGTKPIRKTERGVTRGAGHRTDDRQMVADIMDHLDHFWVQMSNVPLQEATGGGPGRRTRKGIITTECKALVIEERQTQHTFGTDGKPRALTIAWRFRVGRWLSPFLSPRQQTSVIPQSVLGYDSNRQDWEKIVSHYILWLFRSDAKTGRGRTKTVRIDTMFEQCSLPRNERYPRKTIDRFETMLTQLNRDADVCASIAYTPKSKATLDTLPRKQLLDHWMDLMVVITPRDETAQRNALIAKQADSRTAREIERGAKGGKNRG